MRSRRPLLAAAALIASIASAAPVVAEDARTLEDCVALALRRHPAVQGARLEAEAQRAAVGEARAGFFPQALLTASLMRSQSDDRIAGIVTTVDSYNPTASAQLSVIDSGRTRGAVRAADRDAAAAEADFDLRRAEIVIGVKRAFIETQRAEGALRVTETSVLARRRSLPMIERGYENGVRSKFDLARARTDLQSAELERVAAVAKLETARKTLLTAIGTPDASWTPLVGTLDEAPPRVDEALALRTAFFARPELVARRRRIEALESRKALAFAQHLPTIGISGSYTLNRQTRPFTAQSNVWQAGTSASIPIFSGGGVHSAWKAAAARLESARRDLTAAENETALEVRSALIALDEAAARIRTSRQLLRNADELLSLASERFDSGRGGILDLVDAQNQALHARLGFNDGLADRRLALARLEKAVGARVADVSVP